MSQGSFPAPLASWDSFTSGGREVLLYVNSAPRQRCPDVSPHALHPPRHTWRRQTLESYLCHPPVHHRDPGEPEWATQGRRVRVLVRRT